MDEIDIYIYFSYYMGYVFHKKQNVTLKFSRNGRTTTKHKVSMTSPALGVYFNIMSSYISKNDIY